MKNATSTGAGSCAVVRRTKTTTDALTADDARRKDPAALATLVAEAWGGSVRAIIKTGVLIAQSLRAFADDPDRRDAFILALVQKGILTPNEARRRHIAPKLVKLRTIGEHEKLFSLPQIVPFLVPCYTTLYHLAVLFGRLPAADEEQRVADLVKKLAEAPDEITREFLIDETARLKNGDRKAASTVTAANDGVVDHQLASQARPQLILITPDAAEEATIATPYAPEDGLERRLPILTMVRDSDTIAAVILMRLSVLPLIAEKLLNLCGFDCRHARFFLPQPPKTAEVGDELVVMTVDRGDIRITAPTTGTWLDATVGADARVIAAGLYPEATTRLHLFAKSRADGWQALVGAENWSGE